MFQMMILVFNIKLFSYLPCYIQKSLKFDNESLPSLNNLFIPTCLYNKMHPTCTDLSQTRITYHCTIQMQDLNAKYYFPTSVSVLHSDKALIG